MAALAAPAPAGEAPLAHPAPPPEPEAAAAQARAKHVHRCVYTMTFPHTDIAGARRPIEFSRQDFADLLASRHEEGFQGGNNTVVCVCARCVGETCGHCNGSGPHVLTMPQH